MAVLSSNAAAAPVWLTPIDLVFAEADSGSMNDKANLINNTALGAELNDAEIRTLGALMTERDLADGRAVFLHFGDGNLGYGFDDRAARVRFRDPVSYADP